MYRDNENPFKIHEFVAHSTEITCLSFGPKSQQVLATGGNDYKVNVWCVGNASNIWTLGQNKSPISSLCFDAEEQYVVSGAMNGSIKVFDLNEGRLARNLSGHQVNTCSIQYHPYGEFIVSGSVDCNMKVWDVRNKVCIQTYSGHKKEVTCVRFSPDGRWIASSGKDNQLLIWDLVAGKLLNTIRQDPAYVTSFEFNPAEFVIAAVTSTRNVRLWDLETMEPLCSTLSDSSPIRTMAFSGDGNTIYTATKDSLKLYFWEPTAKLKSSVDVGWDKVAELRVSTDGMKLTAGSFNSNFVSVWSIDLDTINNNNSNNNASVAADSKRVSLQQQQQKVSRSKAVPIDNTTTSNDRYNNRNISDNNDSNVDYQADAKSFESLFLGPTVNPIVTRGKPSFSSSSNAEYNNNIDNNNNDKRNQTVVEESSPEMHWESEEAMDEMVFSMSASFQRRFLENQRNIEDGKEKVELVNNDVNSNNTSNGKDNNNSSSIESLQNMLPGSRYVQSSIPTTAAVDVVSQQKDKPQISNHPSSSSAIKKDRKCIMTPPPAHQRISNGNSNRIPTPLNGMRGHALKSGPSRPSSTDDSGDYISYADVDGVNQNPLEIRGLNSRNGGITTGSTATAEAKASREDPGLRAAAKRAAVAATTASADTSSSVVSNNKDQQNRNKKEEIEDLLDKVIANSSITAASISQRLSSIRILKRLWIKGKLQDVVEYVDTLVQSAVHDSSQLVLLADVFLSIELRGNNFTLDSCLGFMEVLDVMISTKECLTFNNVVEALIKSFTELCTGFGELIRSTRAIKLSGGGGGVDLSREERLRKCNKCYSIVERLKGKINRIRQIYPSDYKLLDLLDILIPLIDIIVPF